MVWFILKHIFSTFFDLINIRQLTNQEKDLEILVLRQQLSILQRKLNHPTKPSRAEKMTLAVLAAKLKDVTTYKSVAGYHSDLQTRDRSSFASRIGAPQKDLCTQKQGWQTTN